MRLDSQLIKWPPPHRKLSRQISGWGILYEVRIPNSRCTSTSRTSWMTVINRPYTVLVDGTPQYVKKQKLAPLFGSACAIHYYRWPVRRKQTAGKAKVGIARRCSKTAEDEDKPPEDCLGCSSSQEEVRIKSRALQSL